MGRALRRRPRVLAFASVLLLTSGMVAVLIQEARAVDIVVAPPGRVGGVTDVEVEVRVPAGQRVPILATEGILERTQGDAKVDPALVARARCQGAGSCDAGQLARSGSSSTAILGISFVNAYAGQVQPGNVISQGYFGYGALEVTVPGYGFSGAAGYGYLVGPGAAYGADQLGYGYGYGYGAEVLILLYRVTIDAQVLGDGHHWLTFLVDSGSALIGTLSSPAQHFEVQLPGGGRGGPPAGPITLPPLELGVPVSIPPVGAGQEVLAPLHRVNASLRNLTLVFATSIAGGQLVVDASSAPPAGAPPAEGYATLLFVEINLTQVPEGALGETTLNFTLTPQQLGRRAEGQAVLLHLREAWDPLPTGLLAREPDGNLTFAARIASLSSFALALDEAPPRLSHLQPVPGSTVPPLHAISAELSDNRGLNVSSVSIFVDGQDVTRPAGLSDAGTRTAEGAPRGLALLYVPKVALLTGPHNVTIEASDVSGLRAAESWTFAVDRFPVVRPVAPPHASCTNQSMPLIRADYVGSVAIDLSQVTMVVDNLPAHEPDIGPGSIRYTPPQSLADGPHAVTVAATDTARRPGSATWSFHVDTVGPVIADVTPAEGAVVQTPRPLVSASVGDDGCGIEPGRIVLELDGRPVRAEWKDGVASYEPPHDLGAGRHVVRILAADKAANEGREAWSFVVERPCAVAGVPCWVVAAGLLLSAALAGSVWWLRRGGGRRGPAPPGERSEPPRIGSGSIPRTHRPAGCAGARRELPPAVAGSPGVAALPAHCHRGRAAPRGQRPSKEAGPCIPISESGRSACC